MAAVLPGHPVSATHTSAYSDVLTAQIVLPTQPSLHHRLGKGRPRSSRTSSTEHRSAIGRFTGRPRTVLGTRIRSAARGDADRQSSPSSGTNVAPTDETSVPGLTAKSHLDMLGRFSDQSNRAGTISEQLSKIYESESSDDEADLTIPLSSTENVEPPPLTIHQKRNIRRQNYLNQVSERNDAPFFAFVALSILLPPACILAVAIATGYVDIFP